MKNTDTAVLLLSIRKPYSRLILSGKKQFELRKRLPKINCRYALIYETHPTKAIIGYFEIETMHIKSVNTIWKITKHYAQISETDFRNYYKNKKIGIAIKIKSSRQLEKPISLDSLGVKRAPQDFMYLDGELNELIQKGIVSR